MRHINREIGCYSNRIAETEPYGGAESFNRPTADRLYIKIINFIYTHPNCSRAEILINLGYDPANDYNHCRGQYSTLFAKMLHADIIDYKKSGHHCNYFVPKKGIALLKTVNLI